MTNVCPETSFRNSFDKQLDRVICASPGRFKKSNTQKSLFICFAKALYYPQISQRQAHCSQLRQQTQESPGSNPSRCQPPRAQRAPLLPAEVKRTENPSFARGLRLTGLGVQSHQSNIKSNTSEGLYGTTSFSYSSWGLRSSSGKVLIKIPKPNDFFISSLSQVLYPHDVMLKQALKQNFF